MSTPAFDGKVEIALTATCNSCRGLLLDVCIIAEYQTDRREDRLRFVSRRGQVCVSLLAIQGDHPHAIRFHGPKAALGLLPTASVIRAKGQRELARCARI
jgi:hypothetical protein